MMLKRIRLVCVMGLLGFCFQIHAQSEQDPIKLVRELQQLRMSRLMKARESGSKIDESAIQAEIRAKAKALTDKMDPKSILPEQTLAWAQLLEMAERYQDALPLAEKALSSGKRRYERAAALMVILNSSNATKQTKKLIQHLRIARELSFNSYQQIIAPLRGQYLSTIAQVEGVDEAVSALKEFIRHIPDDENTSLEQHQQQTDSIRVGIIHEIVELYLSKDRHKEAIQELDLAIKAFGDSPMHYRSLSAKKRQIELVGIAAPTITAERFIGGFKGWESLRGKVVLIDFFAHWCGPCKAAFPELRGLYSELQKDGIEILGITTYYGFFGKDRRGITKDEEFSQMPGFIREHQLSWPVVFVDRPAFEAYGVSGIPHVAILDKKGTLRKVKVGFAPGSVSGLKEFLLKLAKEPT